MLSSFEKSIEPPDIPPITSPKATNISSSALKMPVMASIVAKVASTSANGGKKSFTGPRIPSLIAAATPPN